MCVCVCVFLKSYTVFSQSSSYTERICLNYLSLIKLEIKLQYDVFKEEFEREF